MEGARLLVSDLDGTLLGDDAALARFAAWCRPQTADGLRLVYATGRSFESVAQMVDSTPLPGPAAVVGAVGSEIRLFPDGQAVDGWPPGLNGWRHDAIESLVAEHPQLHPQPAESQSPLKLSYFGYDLDQTFLDAFRHRLARAGHRAEVVYSSQRFLDVLPSGVSKGAAIAHLAAMWRVAPQQIVVAGDSGNDLSMFSRGFRGVVVANALPELKSLDSPDVYHATRSYAAGVAEGFQYWFDEKPQTGSLTTQS